MTTRQPAVAGKFYSADATQLRQEVAAMLQLAEAAEPGPDRAAAQPLPKVLIVPHAGYRYSGPVAASAYQLLTAMSQQIKKVVLLGPAHRVYLEGMALPGSRAFATPLGEVAVDTATVARLTALPGVCISDKAHADEHCLEVQLPFLQLLLDDFVLLPVVVGQCSPEQVATLLEQVWGGPETLIVVSTDLSHYLPYDQARQKDAATCLKISRKNPGITGDEACGACALNGLLSSLPVQSLQTDTLDVRTSGDTAGDRQQVVGYGAFALH